MSAGGDFTVARIAVPHDLLVHDSLGLLAPKMRERVEASIAECERLALQAVVYETYRTDELQRVYYARGRTVNPPATPVTNARTNLESWHGFGLAVDVIHRNKRWDMPASWFGVVAKVFKANGLDWGGDWHHPDLPHFQFGTLRASPSDHARELYRTGRLEAVWREVGAM
jgi:peptidoglycan L-alanyl-D-glutamate endopeptidase CwlK